MSTSSNHIMVFVQYCHGKHTVTSSRTLLSVHIASHVFHLALGGGNWSVLCPSHFVSCQRAYGSCWICGRMDPRNFWPLAFSTEEYGLCWCRTVGLPISAHCYLSNLTRASKILRLVRYCVGDVHIGIVVI